jgi:hypothetical protein
VTVGRISTQKYRMLACRSLFPNDDTFRIEHEKCGGSRQYFKYKASSMMRTKKFQLQADLNGRPSEQRISIHWDQ